MRRLRRAWSRAARARLPALRQAGPAALDSREVSAGDTVFCLHGIVHGTNRWLKLQPGVVEVIRAQIDRWVADNEPVYVEPHFGKILGCDSALELKGPNPLERFQIADVLALLPRVAFAFLSLPFAPIGTRLSRDPEWPYIRAALRDASALRAANEVHAMLRVPLPLERDVFDRSGRFKFAYSQSMLDVALGRVGGARRVHLIVGIAHVADLAWLIPQTDRPVG
jgi:hypothetical protein